ncbi:MAG: flagellar motor protein MotB [Marmoricola sp.]|nr:flagellar motor protein MotB [Marmoricola sp.]
MRHKKREIPEEHDNHERWLVTYADMVTLLMVLFIVMFAMSQVDQRKFNELKDGLAAGFGRSTSISDGSSSILDQPGQAAVAPIAPPTFTVTAPQTETTAGSQAVAQHDQAQSQAKYNVAAAEVDRLSKLLARVMAALQAHHLQGDVTATIDSRGLTVSLVSRHVVFQPNLATLSPRGQLLVDTIAPVLRDIPDPLEIDGHTNQVDVKPKYYPTDWELSAARAVTVLRRLNEVDQVPADRLTAAAFGHTRPLIDPSKPGSQEINKRVDIVVLSSLPSETRNLIATVLKNRGATTGAPGGLS